MPSRSSVATATAATTSSRSACATPSCCRSMKERTRSSGSSLRRKSSRVTDHRNLCAHAGHERTRLNGAFRVGTRWFVQATRLATLPIEGNPAGQLGRWIVRVASGQRIGAVPSGDPLVHSNNQVGHTPHRKRSSRGTKRAKPLCSEGGQGPPSELLGLEDRNSRPWNPHQPSIFTNATTVKVGTDSYSGISSRTLEP